MFLSEMDSASRVSVKHGMRHLENVVTTLHLRTRNVQRSLNYTKEKIEESEPVTVVEVTALRNMIKSFTT